MTHRRPGLGIIWFLVGFVPLLNISTLGALVYFGLHGNRIAVLSGRFTDEPTFIAVQNAWRNWGFGLLAVLLVLFMAAGIYGAFSPSATR
jgi:hypothetical protein